MTDESAWKEAYHECSEDLRHYNAVSWQIPSAILAVDSFFLQFVYAATNISSVQKAVALLVAGIFSLILTLNFVKYVYRSDKRIKTLGKLEDNLPEGSKRFTDTEPWYIRYPLGYPAALFLFAISITLLVLAFLFPR